MAKLEFVRDGVEEVMEGERKKKLLVVVVGRGGEVFGGLFQFVAVVLP